MAFTYAVATDRGRVRLIIGDTSAAAYMFEDDEIDTFLALESGVKNASALALETMASTEAYVQKVIKLLDLSTDGAKTSDALLKRAAMLRSQAATDDLATNPGFEIAEWNLGPASVRDYYERQYEVDLL